MKPYGSQKRPYESDRWKCSRGRQDKLPPQPTEWEPMTGPGGRDGLPCDHCGQTAIWFHEDGTLPAGVDLFCAECEIAGVVELDEEGQPFFRVALGATCERDVCTTCPGKW